MNSRKHRGGLILGVVMVFSILTVPVMAADFPTKPVTLIIPWPAGGGTDLYLRILAESVSKYLGQPIVIDNKPGGTGTVGPALMAATGKPDGYILSQLPPAVFMFPHTMKVTWNPLKDFTYVLLVASYTSTIVVRHDAPWKTLRELIDYARANPNKVTYTTSGAWGSNHIFMERLALQEGIKWINVPMKGDAESIPAVLGGHVTVGTPSGGEVAQVEAGQLRVLAVLTPKRTKRWPNIPTTKELYNISGGSRFGIAGPKGMDPAVVKILHDAFKKGLEDPAFQEKSFKIGGVEPDYMNSEDYARHTKEEYEGRGKEAEQFGLKKK